MIKKAVLFLFLISVSGYAQYYQTIDSLKKELQKFDAAQIKSGRQPSLADSVKVRILNDLGLGYVDFDPANSKLYTEQALGLAVKINFERGIAESNLYLGRFYNVRGNHQLAKDYVSKALSHFKMLKDEKMLAYAYGELAIIFSKLGNFTESLKYSLLGLKIYEKRHENLGIANSYINIGILYKQQGKYEEALQNYSKGLAAVKDVKNDDGDYIRAFIYNNIGHALLKQQKEEEALDILVKAKNLGAKFHNTFFDADTNKAIGDCYFFMEDYSKALQIYLISLEMNKTNKDEVGISECYINIGYTYFKLGDSRKAIENSNRGRDIAKKIGQLEWMKNVYQNLSEIYRSLGNYKEAYQNYSLFKKTNDSMFSNEKEKKITELQLNYEFSKKQAAIKAGQQKKDALQEVKEKRQRNTIYLILLALLLVSVFTFWIYYNLKRNKKQQKIIETQKAIVEQQNEQIQKALTEKETLLREIHHRVKNNLQIISSLLNIQSENITDKNVLTSIREGQSRVQAISLIHQNLYQSEHVASVDIANYLKELVSYLSHTFGEKTKTIQVGIETEGIEFDIDTAIPLGLIVNELVSNAYKYAFEAGQNGNININITNLGKTEYELKVENDGRKLPDDFDIRKSKSLGLKLVAILSRQLRGSFISKSDNGLTSFVVVFKNMKAFQTDVN